jgi:hypothetical protein
MKQIITKYKFQLLLFLIVFILFLVNYKSGTYLSGWDSLQTELNPGLAVKRAFFSVWEEYQSFGLTAGMAHAADLPRAVFLWIISFILPQNMIRYFYHFLMLFLGGLGALEVIKSLDSRLRGNDKKNNETPLRPSGFEGQAMKQSNHEIIPFLGALFYMLNLGTVQIFYMPYESFSTFFAFLPWGIWAFLKIINGNYRLDSRLRGNDILLFFLINLLGTPAFYTQQLFVVYILVLGCVAMGVMGKIRDMKVIKKILLAFLLILIINSFWLLPQFYFLKTNGRVVSEAKANQLATEDVFYQNYEKGTLGNFLKLEGFYFDLKGINNTFLFAPWKDHFNSPIIGILPYLFGGLGILGLLVSLGKKKNPGFILIYFLCATALLLATPPFSWINELLRKITIINQFFRSPFTKFIIPYSLVYSYFVAKGISYLDSRLPLQGKRGNDNNETPLRPSGFKGQAMKQSNHGFILNTLYFILITFTVLYSLPSLKGYFISSEMKVKIPQDYHFLIDYFKYEDKNKRIALLPDYTFWGWFFNKWGYNGSGFLWYGIEQPVVSRTFDVWSKASESYFWEAKTAFEAEDIKKILNVFDKYQIDYLILDKSLIPVVSSYKALQYDRINELLKKSPKITPIFAGENILLYKIDHDYYSKNFISLSTNLNNIGQKINITNDDTAFSENGFYANNQNLEPDIFYPFLNLTSQTNLKEKNWQINEDDNYFYLSTSLTINTDNFDLNMPDIYRETILVNGQPINISLKLEPIIEDKKLTVKIEKKALKTFNTNIDQKTNFGFSDLTLSQNIGYLIKTLSVNKQGLHLFFYVIDETKKQSYLEDRLDNQTNYFVLPPRYDYGLGYTFAFQNKSFKNLTALNNLKELSLYLFPYKALKEMKFVKKGFNKSDVSFSNDYEAKKINYFTYQIKINNITIKPYNNIILFQAYDPGWLAFANGKLLDHVLVNNWANGWIFNNVTMKQFNNSTIYIIFWPQYLEFIGFGLLIIAFIVLLTTYRS